ncbi:hypothetical protein [Gluconacetobacter asukensis]|uniref:Uncharacterized protein n=1 Tax=Gluconacetobacter asukensis TaxID=1017181 RepID=A0A7W4J3T4_9PROT|nr:hypothetical protein [Gluconacetobacter asukensis]MBB2174144.1 hypothetical protein [Gluconacetobacter asukensis]
MDQVFPATWLKVLAAATPHDLTVTEGQAMIGNGLGYFGSNGLAVVNPAP